MRIILATILVLLSLPAFAGDGITRKQSAYSAAETLDRLEKILKEKGITVFTRVDHGAGAAKAGIEMPPTQLLIFGNPKLGSPLMKANRTIGLDLPMKALAYTDDEGNTWLAYVNPETLKTRNAIEGKDEIFAKMAGALDKLTSAAVK